MVREKIQLATLEREGLYDITAAVQEIVDKSPIQNGLVSLYAQGATSAIMIQENWDDSVQADVIQCLQKIAPRGVWLHDQQDGNGDSHIKAGLVGPSEVIPLIEGNLGLSRWQNIFLCEFDGPRQNRTVICTLIGEE